MVMSMVIQSILSGRLAGAPDLGSADYDIAEEYRLRLTNGTGANQANNIFTDTRSLAASGSESLDLAGSLSNALGAVLTFTAIKVIRVRADPGNTNNVVVGGAPSNGFVGPFADATDKIAIPPGGMFEVVNPSAAGRTVTPGTGDLLLVANSGAGTGVTYSIEIVGEA